ncbi:GNAT family N-acetyltransferase [Salinicoccus hispanicus]|uniref:GNAT family N-acetyltransferase n=1 Tax=Salinicoccus hispanicus TaxID=157225 RepID=A0A6N8U170_9STAP|nr:GNAT family N-acetyltransferase [Salinicoccus hispanicus]MXQ51087.1 GNAT family N-acetyltransferase [Salinicoccus hispanicus]
MNHLGTKQLKTERLLLRPLAMEDAEAMFDNWASDPDVTEYLTWPAHQSMDVTRLTLRHWTSQYVKNDFYQWAIVPHGTEGPIGTISVVAHDNSVDMVHIGYCMGKPWWGKGYMTESLSRLIKFFFEEVGVNRIESKYDVRNASSGKVMEKCGLLYEGTTRGSDVNNQGICDSALYGMIRSDYYNT